MITPNLYEVAIGMIPGIGCQNTKQLISYCGSAERVFKTPKGKLMKIPGIGTILAEAIIKQNVLKCAEEELTKAEKNSIEIIFYTDKKYPKRLKHIYDAPTLLYYKGNADLNNPKVIGIVGTRQATSYGKDATEKIISELRTYQPLIISGLAYGIDITAHKAAMACKLPTLGVMASGMDIIYPLVHKEIALRMASEGGLMTEYKMGTKPEAPHFPSRNRIVAGMCDMIIVIEAAERGGALITAEIANSYDREVFAIPGNIGNKYSEGCNKLIKAHKAHIFTNVKDIEYIMNWDLNIAGNTARKFPIKDFENLSEEEIQIASLLVSSEGTPFDEISWKMQIQVGKLSALLLNMEFNGYVKTLPGKKYKLT